tara:strand:+ start:960 stop:1226 length:267 start_codon:yes stop_codon:yes gene_type:complete
MKVTLKSLDQCNHELIRNFAGAVTRHVVLCCEKSFRQFEGLNVNFNNIDEYLDNLKFDVDFLYCDSPSHGKLVKMLQNRRIIFLEELS